MEIALTISKAIGRQSLKINVSEGIASNKLISQIASKLNKPAAFLTVPTGDEKLFLHPLPSKWLPGIGPKTATRLNAAGLVDIGQLAATPTDLLALLLSATRPRLCASSPTGLTSARCCRRANRKSHSASRRRSTKM